MPSSPSRSDRRSKDEESTHSRSRKSTEERKRVDRKERKRSLPRRSRKDSSTPTRSRSPLRPHSGRRHRDEENGYSRRRHRSRSRDNSRSSRDHDSRRRTQNRSRRESSPPRRRRRDTTSSSCSSSSSSSSSPSPRPSNNNNGNGSIPAPVPPPVVVSTTVIPGYSMPVDPPVVPIPAYFGMPTAEPTFSLLPPPPPPPPPGMDIPPPPPPSTPPPPEPPRSHPNPGMNAMITELSSKNHRDNFTSPDAMDVLIRNKPTIYSPDNVRRLPAHWGRLTVTDYKIVGQVGEGTYGQVFKAICNKTYQTVALKKVRLENEREGFPITAVREIKLLRQLEHNNIVKLLDIITEVDKDNKLDISAFFLVFEYVDHDLNGLLESQLVEFKEIHCASLFKQLLLALQHCHANNLLHRDLKCANILVNNRGELKLGDFGLARIYTNKSRLYTNRVITLWYRPPELLLGEENYGPAIDIWSAGCILGELFVKKPIFQGQTELAQLEIICQTCGTPSPNVWPNVTSLPHFSTMRQKQYFSRTLTQKFAFMPKPALDLFDQLLSLDPDKRPSASEALADPWLADVDLARVPPMKLPTNQDCHEWWSKQHKGKQRNSQVKQISQKV